MMIRKIILISFIFLSTNLIAQHSVRDSSISFSMIGATFAYQIPGGDLSERFGNNFNAGFVFQYKLKNNLIFGLDINYIFSDVVRQNNILDKFLTPEGNLIDANGQYATVQLFERGLKFELKAGKIFPLLGPNKNSGLLATIGAGYIQHKILIDTPGNPVPYLEGDYRKGYDRFTNGLSVTEFIGYINFSNRKLINFFGGFEFTQGYTKNKRGADFDTGIKDNKSRDDLLFGLRLGWIFPLYKQSADKVYIN